MSQTKQDLYAAMAKAFDRLRYMQKSGTGSNTGISVDTVKRDVGRTFQQVGLIWLPSEVDRSVEPHVNKDGDRSGYMTSVVIDFTTIHVETGQSVVQRASGHGFDSTDKGGLKAWSQAIKAWGITTFMIEAGFDAETDDDDEQIDKDAIERSFKRMAQDIRAVAPSRAESDKRYADIIGYYKTHSGRPVEDAREFKSRADARQAYAALEQAKEIWSQQRFEREGANEKAKGARPMTEKEMDAAAAKQEKV